VVTALKLDYSRRRKSAQAIAAKGSSSWPTMTVGDAESGQTKPNQNRCGGSAHESLRVAAAQWPTATKQDAGSSGRHTTDPSKPMHPGTTLTDACRLWKTPRTITGGGESGERKKELGRRGSGGGDLQAQVETWPTPNVADEKLSPNWPHKGGNPTLCMASVRWPTPNQRDHKGSDLKSRNGGASLSHFAETGERVHSTSLLQDPATQDGEVSWPTSPVSPRRLNPAFVCWLMGWNFWWTNPARNSFAQSATGSYLFRLRSLLASLLAGLALSSKKQGEI
jgi:hypothetical protein